MQEKEACERRKNTQKVKMHTNVGKNRDKKEKKKQNKKKREKEGGSNGESETCIFRSWNPLVDILNLD